MPALQTAGGEVKVRMKGPREKGYQASCVAIEGRALAISGPPGSGKSSLALALIDRGAQLIGDDAVTLRLINEGIVAVPPPNIAGKLEIHGVGIVNFPLAPPTPLALILQLGSDGDRLPDVIKREEVFGISIPTLAFAPGDIAPALRAEWALAMHGLCPVQPD